MLSVCCLVFFGLVDQASAAGVEGASIPAWGGGWAGPGDPGARGVLYNPVASGTGEAPEILVDVGVLGLQVAYWPDVTQDPTLVRVPAPHPTLTAAFPIGDRFGVSTYFHAPYVRSDFTTGLLFLESALQGSWRATDRFVLAGGVRLGMSRVGATIPLDTGALVNDSLDLDEDLALPEGDPFLEGDQLVQQKNTFTASPVVAASVRVGKATWIHGVFRPPWIIRARPAIRLRPSNELDALLEGNVQVRVPLPLRATLAATIPVGRFTLLPEVEYVGWQQTSFVRITPSDLRVVSSDPVFNKVLASVGLAEGGFLEVAEGPQNFDLGWRNVVHGGVQGQFEVNADVDLRAGLLWTTAAVGPAAFSEFNLDFATLALRGGAAWDVSRRVRLSFSAEYFASPPRERRDDGGGLVEFYDLDMWRAGITTQIFLRPRD